MLIRKIQSVLFAHCPICGFREGARTKRTSSDRWAGLFRIYPFECRTCNVKFHAFLFKSSGASPEK